jgi:hypothetical protein
MYNFIDSRDRATAYWDSTPTDVPHYLNGFKGTWAFTDYSLIPEPILEFLNEYYRDRLGEFRKNNVKVVSLTEINDLMNSVWEGPGSMSKLINMMYEIRQARFETVTVDTSELFKGYEIPTIESNLGEVVDTVKE